MLKINFFTVLLLLFILSLVYQIKKFNKNKPEDCLSAFKFNNISGLILFLGILGSKTVFQFWKIWFLKCKKWIFSIFSKHFKDILDVKYRFKTCLGHQGGPFHTIYHDFRALYHIFRKSDFWSNREFWWFFEQFLDFKQAPGANWEFKGAFEYAKWLNTCISLSGTPQITLMSYIQQRRLQFSKIKDVNDFEVKKWSKISVYRNFKGAVRRL